MTKAFSQSMSVREQLYGNTADRLSLTLFVLFMAIVAFTGGSSRSDDPQQLFVRLASVILGGLGLLRANEADLRAVRVPLFVVMSFAALVVLQLVPLPPVMWARLPGHHVLAEASGLAGVGDVWRPLSLSPDLGLNTLVSFFPPLAMIILVASLRLYQQYVVAAALLLLILMSAVIALLQANGALGSFYDFRVQGFGGAVGLFANRNHQALFLVLAFPLIGVLLPSRSTITGWQIAALMLVVAFFLVMTLATGSRAGLILGALAMVGGWLIHMMSRSARGRTARSARLMSAGGAVLVATTVVVATLASSRAGTIQRLFSEDVAQEIRLKLFRPMLDMAWKYFPAGSGFGSFVDVFKMREQLGDLGFTYLNHAHNDPLELLIEGGLPGLILALLTIIWLLRATTDAWSNDRRQTEGISFARAGSVIVALTLLASFADYPIRTPTIAVVSSIALCWLCRGQRTNARAASDRSQDAMS